MTEEKFKIEADSNGVWISAVSDDFTLAAVVHFLRSKGVRKYDLKAVKKFAGQKSRDPQKIAERDPTQEKNSVIVVHLTEDNMTASVAVEPPFFTNPWPSKADILEALKQKKVVFGLDEETVEKLAELKLSDAHVIVARGKPPVNGENARIELLLDPDKAPAVDCDGEKIDHRARSAFINVKQGDEIAVKHPATRGEDGMTVVGAEVNPAAGKDATFPATSGFNISENGLLLTSAIDGRFFRKNNKLSIAAELDVKGDVDFSVGNIDFRGSVKIFGSVCDGFQVLASGDIEIKKTVESAVVESAANIVITGGVLGMGKGHIIAGGNITASFVNQAYIRSSGEIKIKNSVLHSDVSAYQTVTVMGGKKSQIIGGKTQAELSVICDTLGSEIGTKTEVVVGTPPYLNERLKELQTSIIKRMEDLETLEANLVFLNKREQSGALSEKQRSSLIAAIKSKYQLQTILRSNQDELEDIEDRLELSRTKGTVKVKGVCYPGVAITIRGCKYIVREPFRNVAFIYDKEEREVKLRAFDEVPDQ